MADMALEAFVETGYGSHARDGVEVTRQRGDDDFEHSMAPVSGGAEAEGGHAADEVRPLLLIAAQLSCGRRVSFSPA
jgi:hypothetical protein